MSKRYTNSAESGIFEDERLSVNSEQNSSDNMSEPPLSVHHRNHNQPHSSRNIMRQQQVPQRSHHQYSNGRANQNHHYNSYRHQEQVHDDSETEEDEEADNNIEEDDIRNGEDGANAIESDVDLEASDAEDALVDLTNDDDEDVENEEEENPQENGNYDSDQEEEQDDNVHQNHRQRHNARRSSSVECLGPVNTEEEIISVSTIPNEVQLLEHEIVSLADFEKLKVLGTGAYGRVLLVRKLNGFDSGKLYAMKMLPKIQIVQKKKTTEHTKTERVILEKIIDLPFLVNLQYAFQTDMRLYLVLDYVGGGELFTHLYKHDNFGEELTKFYIAELILAIEQLHERNIIYRDVKLENILLDRDGHIVLTDFGLSKLLPHSNALATSFCGTIEYMAPEVCRQQEGHGLVIDWWSIGVLCVELYTGTSPFARDNEENPSQADVAQRIKEEEPNIGESMQGAARNFADLLLIKDATQRLGYREGAIELKRHPFFNGMDWEALRNRRIKPNMIPQIRNEMDVSNFSEDFTTMSTEDQDIEVPQNVDRLFRGFEYVNPHILKLMRRRPSAYDLEDNDDNVLYEELNGEENGEVENESEMAEEEQEEVDDEEVEAEGIIEEDEEMEKEEYEEISELPMEQLDINCNRPILDNLLRLENAEPKSPFFLKYQLESKNPLGSGKFSICMMCSDRQTQQQYAVKIVNINNYDSSNNEVAALKACKENKQTKNNTIVQYHDDLQDDYFMYIVMELLMGEDLLSRVRNEEMFTEKQARGYFKQIALGVRHLHSVNYVHRDLKPDNIIFKDVTSQELKIVDFGFAVPKSLDTGKKLALTPLYAAPEAFESTPAEFSRDIWSLGIILYVMLCGTTPFLSESEEVYEDQAIKLKKLMKNIKRGTFGQGCESYTNLSKEAKDLLDCLLKKNPDERITIKEVLGHAWLKKRSFKNGFVLAANNDTTAENIAMTLRAYDQVQNEIQIEPEQTEEEEEAMEMEELFEDENEVQVKADLEENSEDLRFQDIDFVQPSTSNCVEIPVSNGPVDVVYVNIDTNSENQELVDVSADCNANAFIIEDVQIIPSMEEIIVDENVMSTEVPINPENFIVTELNENENDTKQIVKKKNIKRPRKTYKQVERSTRSQIIVKEEPTNAAEVVDFIQQTVTTVIYNEEIQPVAEEVKPTVKRQIKSRSRVDYEILSSPVIEQKLRGNSIVNYKISKTNTRKQPAEVSKDRVVLKEREPRNVRVEVNRFLLRNPISPPKDLSTKLQAQIGKDFIGFHRSEVGYDFLGRSEPIACLDQTTYIFPNSPMQLYRIEKASRSANATVDDSSKSVKKRQRRKEVDGIEAMNQKSKSSEYVRFSSRVQSKKLIEENIPIAEPLYESKPTQSNVAQAIPESSSMPNKSRKRKADTQEEAVKQPVSKKARKSRQSRKTNAKKKTK